MALEFCRQHRDRFHNIITVSVREPNSLNEAFASGFNPATDLIIVDDEAFMPAAQLQEVIIDVTNRHRDFKIIVTTERSFSYASPFPVIGQLGLPPDAIVALLGRHGIAASEIPDEASRLSLGSPRMAITIADIAIHKKLPIAKVIEELHSFERSGLIDPIGQPLTPRARSSLRMAADVRITSDELLRKLGKNPELVYFN
ncbi:hypothetical protein [Bradyrhizobium sp. OAE829]|uniref:hypothetical protein n=1 Tax=Bradyrhizobium sp. OAE829 TaxID=2663807 RepID=UPI00178A6B6B